MSISIPFSEQEIRIIFTYLDKKSVMKKYSHDDTFTYKKYCANVNATVMLFYKSGHVVTIDKNFLI